MKAKTSKSPFVLALSSDFPVEGVGATGKVSKSMNKHTF